MIDPFLPFPKWVSPQNPFYASSSSSSPPFSSLVFLSTPLITKTKGDLSNTDCYNYVSKLPTLTDKLCGKTIAARIQLYLES
ncbi:hypothetical protein POTOM_051414 [Populus tomentosa]|uniref:Uncharacterized protein n=1 Tax=Populus tomentosa TaxID=118781 RepID=A0A8X7YGB7_POPTO|nr:hypothetical protein POTOM_051414 [Populus tomentosa]